MMPNIDPKTMKKMMDRMGIKSQEIEAKRVVIECDDKNIIVEEPQVMTIETQGTMSFQISGHVIEKEKSISVEITQDDIQTVMSQSGIDDSAKAEQALKDSNGDIAEAIMKLKEES